MEEALTSNNKNTEKTATELDAPTIQIGDPQCLKKTMAISAGSFQLVVSFCFAHLLIQFSLVFLDPTNFAGPSNGPPGQIQLTVPGAMISEATGLMRGHGTFIEGEALFSSLAGLIVQTNKLVQVKPVRTRYQGDIGDVVVGRVVEVQQKRWRVDTNSRLHSVLLLTSVNLPGGELRRKSVEDELLMREYLREGDLVSAEVQQCFHDGALSLHTRSLKYGKLGQGLLVKVLPHLVRRRKSHFHNLPFGASVILGCNGFIWVSRYISVDEAQTGGYIEDAETVPEETRETIARTANCIRLLARNSVPLYDTTIICAFNCSLPYAARELINWPLGDEIAQEVVQRCAMETEDMDQGTAAPMDTAGPVPAQKL